MNKFINLYTLIPFDNAKELEKYLTQFEEKINTSKLATVVAFYIDRSAKELPYSIKFKLRFPSDPKIRDWKTSSLFPELESVGPRQPEEKTTASPANSLKMISARLSCAFIFLGVISYSECGLEMDSEYANEFLKLDKSLPYHAALQKKNRLFGSLAVQKKFVGSLVIILAKAAGNRRNSFDEEDTVSAADFEDTLAMRNELAASVPKNVVFPLIRLMLKGISKGAAETRSHSDVHDYTAKEVLKKVGVSQAVLENSEDVSMKTLVRALKKAAELFGSNLRNGASGRQSRLRGLRREGEEPDENGTPS